MVDLMLVLHCHIPYVRKRGIWPYGEDWIFEAILESYLPLVNMLNDLSLSDVDNLVTISLSPILVEQLSDEHIKNGFDEYLEKKIEQTTRDIHDFTRREWVKLTEAAKHRLSMLKESKSLWLSISSDLPKAFRTLHKNNLVDIAASSATHAILPLLSAKSIDRQISIGLKSFRERIGFEPTTFWLPECAYKLGIEDTLEKHNIKTVFLGSKASDESHKNRPFTLGNSDLVSLSRNWELSRWIWSTENGFPGNPKYREFGKRYKRSGNRYWRNTGANVSMSNKATYHPIEAFTITSEHAKQYVELIEHHAKDSDNQTILLSVDTEILGQDWYEGIEWLKKVLLKLSKSNKVNLCTPNSIQNKYNPKDLDSQRPETCSWVKDGDLRPWNRGSVLWMWDDIGTMSAKFFDLEKDKSNDKQLIAQLQRELLLCQSSDWPFLITTKSSKAYGEKRFRMHTKAFWDIVDLIETNFKDFKLELLMDRDNPFPFIG